MYNVKSFPFINFLIQTAQQKTKDHFVEKHALSYWRN